MLPFRLEPSKKVFLVDRSVPFRSVHSVSLRSFRFFRSVHFVLSVFSVHSVPFISFFPFITSRFVLCRFNIVSKVLSFVRSVLFKNRFGPVVDCCMKNCYSLFLAHSLCCLRSVTCSQEYLSDFVSYRLYKLR